MTDDSLRDEAAHRIYLEPAFRETRPGEWAGQDRSFMRYRRGEPTWRQSAAAL